MEIKHGRWFETVLTMLSKEPGYTRLAWGLNIVMNYSRLRESHVDDLM